MLDGRCLNHGPNHNPQACRDCQGHPREAALRTVAYNIPTKDAAQRLADALLACGYDVGEIVPRYGLEHDCVLHVTASVAKVIDRAIAGGAAC